ncbi:hypothetical protein [Pontixanthobacter sp.]|uniref:hypothetical protein n=1 Tax=Pontixanthobacter sp. TaxID=2792078 RepID=UPI003C7D4A4B
MNLVAQRQTIAATTRSAGQPLYALIGVLLLYIALRAYWWEMPLSQMPPALTSEGVHTAQKAAADQPPSARTPEHRPMNDIGFAQQVALPFTADRQILLLDGFANPAVQDDGLSNSGLETGPPDAGPLMPSLAALSPPDITAMGPLPRLAAAPEPPPDIRSFDAAEEQRWSLNGWLLYRSDNVAGPLSASGQRPPTYGASQAGAVLRYRLAPTSAHRPAAHMRVTSALEKTREQELAAGISAQPMPRIPVIIAAEARVSRQNAGTEIRPALFAYTQMPAISLPHEFRAEVYAQAGYVGRDFSTLFADGQARIDREVARARFAAIRAGGGIWGGAQDGAERLDIGPSISAELDIAGRPARLSADYRYRAAGRADPQNGAAITLTTGF